MKRAKDLLLELQPFRKDSRGKQWCLTKVWNELTMMMLTSDLQQKYQCVDLNDPLTPGGFDGSILKGDGAWEGGGGAWEGGGGGAFFRLLSILN